MFDIKFLVELRNALQVAGIAEDTRFAMPHKLPEHDERLAKALKYVNSRGGSATKKQIIELLKITLAEYEQLKVDFKRIYPRGTRKVKVGHRTTEEWVIPKREDKLPELDTSRYYFKEEDWQDVALLNEKALAKKLLVDDLRSQNKKKLPRPKTK